MEAVEGVAYFGNECIELGGFAVEEKTLQPFSIGSVTLIGRVEDELSAAMHKTFCRAWPIATSDPMLQLDNDG